MKRFFIKTLGCKTNQIESALIAQKLTNNGFAEVNNVSEADYYILNSCSVTQLADNKNISFLKKAKKENPKIKTVITGCMAQLEKENLLKNDFINYVIGNYEKNDIAEILNSEIKLSVSDIFSRDLFRYEKIIKTNRTRAQVKIQDGCNNRCSYCTIPYARGKNRSNSIENIIEQINIFSANGYYEAVLTGIHIGQWGNDFPEKKTLQTLLEAIEKTPIKRYRLGSLNPIELNEKLIDFLSNSEKFCPHFHLSLQSVCNKTLENMNRKYTENQIFELVDMINKKFNNAFIGSDIISGFPDETEEDFEITLNNLNRLEITRIHVFPYSRRKGTPADIMPNQISENEKKRRVNLIQKISDRKLETFLKNNINTQNEAIIERIRDKKTNLLKGITKNYINVLINGNDNLKDTIQKVQLKEIINTQGKILGEIVT